MSTSTVLVFWAVVSGVQNQVCWYKNGNPLSTVCVNDNTGRVGVQLYSDSDYTLYVKTGTKQSMPFNVHTPRACDTGLIDRLRAVCGKKCAGVN